MAQLPSDGVGLDADPIFERNDEFYAEELGGAGHGDDADASEMEAREERAGAEEEDEEEREKRLHVVESAEKNTADKDGAPK